MLRPKTKWNMAHVDEQRVQHLAETWNISRLMAKILVRRGWDGQDRYAEWVSPSMSDFHDPLQMDDMAEAIERLQQAKHNGEPIRIYGDYDCDGVTSTTIMHGVLRTWGADVDYYIPDRFEEGYGLNRRALERAQEDGIRLIVCVDNGISAAEEIAYAYELGMDVIVTDHHHPPDVLPQCHALVNPKKPGCSYPYKALSGAGIAYKLGTALIGEAADEWLDIAAIGTIADLVPLTGENRLIAKYGLERLNRTKHLGLQALCHVSRLTNEVLDEQHVGFALGPRLNACGRLAHASEAVRLLTSDNKKEAEELALNMDRLNRKRQQIVESVTNEAVEWIEVTYGNEHLPSALVVSGDAWHPGVVGIVASRLVERYYLPTIVLSVDKETQTATGSARSIQGVHMVDVLNHAQQWLTEYGGHEMAAGVTLPLAHIAPFREAVDGYVGAQFNADDFIPVTAIDAVVQVDEVSVESIGELQRLAPFGVGNREPVVLFTEITMSEMKRVGRGDAHLKCQLQQADQTLAAIGFGKGALVSQISPLARVHVIGTLQINDWNNISNAQLLIQDMHIAQRQYFDCRGSVRSKLEAVLPTDEPIVVGLFSEETSVPSWLDAYPVRPIRFGDVPSADQLEPVHNAYHVLLYDLPQSFQQCQHICAALTDEQRLYVAFEHEDSVFFRPPPTREQFKWYYAFLKQRGSFNVERDGTKLARSKGWHAQTVQLMTNVFSELSFIDVVDGIVQVREQPRKQDLASSRTYQQNQRKWELEQAFIYSPFSETIQLLDQLATDAAEREAVTHGL